MTTARLDRGSIRTSERALARLDPALGRWIARIDTPVLKRQYTAYASPCRAVIAQELSNRAASAICSRFFAGSSPSGPTPHAVAVRSDRWLRDLGLSRQKVRYVRGLTEAFGHGGDVSEHVRGARRDVVTASRRRLSLSVANCPPP